jgi:hypothetical protein
LAVAATPWPSCGLRPPRPRSPAETPDAVVTDVLELEEAITSLLSS